MNKNATKLTLSILLITLIAGLGYWGMTSLDETGTDHPQSSSLKETVSHIPEQEKMSKSLSKKARGEYFFKLVRDPATNSIPENIRAREVNHAQLQPSIQQVNQKFKSQRPGAKVAEGFEWRLAGPPAVGGRTRALGIDQRDPDIIIAGGVSGGIWKSTDGGDNWTLRTPDFENFSVTSLTQDPTNSDTWYYTSGELISNSASAPGATYYGTGIFRSTDNGDTWNRIPGTEDVNTQFDSQFDYGSKVKISPTTGTVLTSSNGIGIFRAPNGNDFTDLTLGGFGEHLYADVVTAPNGDVAAVLSTTDAGTAGGSPGVYISQDDGQSWTNITPNTFPSDYGRSVITFAPSDPNIIYVLTQKIGDGSNQSVSFHMIDVSGGLPGSSQDRSANLPDFGGPVGGVNLQGGYNMTVSVKPDNPDVVTLGGINLFRSFDGFATAPSGDTPDQRDEFWIGGYAKANNVSQYSGQHPDQHVQVYDPSNPDRLWVGHDGGLSVTDDVTAVDVSWTDRNDGYIVTQFYDASIGPDEDDPRFLGGTQDNGTPFFQFRDEDDIGTDIDEDVSSGDGGFSFITENLLYVSNQQGASGNSRIIRLNSDGSNFAIVQPAQAQTAFFINPYAVDPNDEGVMYYPGGSSLFRNTMVDEINNTSGGTNQGWEEVNAASTPGFNISALKVSTQPQDILYYAGSNDNSAPVIQRLNNASTSNDQPTDISIPNAPAGAFVHDIAINPNNSNDVLVVMSNYNIVGLYHTSDGGSSWQAVEGNLEGENDPTSPNAGPSLRTATIIPSESGSIYLVGTSTGVYGTQNLQGSNTQWGRESAFDTDGIADIGFSVVENMTSRVTDGDVAVGTHGRGMFVGRFQGEVGEPQINPRISTDPVSARAGEQITITATDFQFSDDISPNDIEFENTNVREIISVNPNELVVVVPQGTLPRNAEPNANGNFDITITVNTENNGTLTTAFEIEPPNENSLDQNFPNPFGLDGTNIPISLRNSSNVTLEIYDTSGRRVEQTLVDESFQAGTYTIPVDFSNNASGIYVYRIIAEPSNGGGDTFVNSEKFTFIR